MAKKPNDADLARKVHDLQREIELRTERLEQDRDADKRVREAALADKRPPPRKRD